MMPEGKEIVPPAETSRLVDKLQSSRQKLSVVVVAFLIVLAGLGTGYLLAAPSGGIGLIPGQGKGASESRIAKGTEVGSKDTETFKDTAEGAIEEGGLDGEGTHKLIREGGPSQTAYLTSSVVDLDLFVGRKVKVWGQTYQGQKAGWFMDVGRLKVLE